MPYQPNNQKLDIDLNFRPFDQVYLVDSKREKHGLESDPKKGIYSSISDFISTVIDKKSGTIYSKMAVNQNATEKEVIRFLAPMQSKSPSIMHFGTIH